MMKMCFIDDEVCRGTLDVILSLKKYANDNNIIELDCELLAVACDWEGIDEDTYDYFQKFYIQDSISLIKCTKEEDLKDEIEKRLNQDICFMVDLHLRSNEEDRLDSDSVYECLSMKVLNWIKNESYHMYSLFLEDPYKDKWSKRYRKLYHKAEPTIYGREKLQPGSFCEEYAKEILGV